MASAAACTLGKERRTAVRTKNEGSEEESEREGVRQNMVFGEEDEGKKRKMMDL